MINFYECRHCGNIVMFVKSSGVVSICCGDQMQMMVPGTSDGATEKHVPVIIVNGDRVVVKIGEKNHPMEKDHYIEWIVLETNKGIHATHLDYDDKDAAAGFTLQDGEHAIAAYEYCNIHGLWMKEL